MSGIVKKVLKHKKAAAVLCLLGILILGLMVLRLYFLAFLLTAAAVVNELTFRKMNKQKAVFGIRSMVRNVDCLVIGDVGPKMTKGLTGAGTAVCIHSPGCTLASAYEVLRHTFSILKENGEAVLVVKERNIKKECYSLFEISFFHIVTINRLKLRDINIMSRLPVIFAPVKSLAFLLEMYASGNMKDYEDEEIKKFCSERGIEVRVLVF